MEPSASTTVAPSLGASTTTTLAGSSSPAEVSLSSTAMVAGVPGMVVASSSTAAGGSIVGPSPPDTSRRSQVAVNGSAAPLEVEMSPTASPKVASSNHVSGAVVWPTTTGSPVPTT